MCKDFQIITGKNVTTEREDRRPETGDRKQKKGEENQQFVSKTHGFYYDY